jgi:quaternary ammonium compound-resistance protein SugE
MTEPASTAARRLSGQGFVSSQLYMVLVGCTDANRGESLRREPRRFRRVLDLRVAWPDRARAGLTAWSALLLAGLLEIGWALGLKYSDGLTRFWPSVATVAAIVLSFGLLGLSLKSVPFGTAYAVWTGIGAAGTMIIGMIAFGESTDIARVTCLTLIIAGMVGLKLVSPQ